MKEKTDFYKSLKYELRKIAKENKIKQTIKFELDKGTQEYQEFMDRFSEFVEGVGGQKIEGVIENFRAETTYCENINIDIRTVKEDKLKLIDLKKED